MVAVFQGCLYFICIAYNPISHIYYMSIYIYKIIILYIYIHIFYIWYLLITYYYISIRHYTIHILIFIYSKMFIYPNRYKKHSIIYYIYSYIYIFIAVILSINRGIKRNILIWHQQRVYSFKWVIVVVHGHHRYKETSYRSWKKIWLIKSYLSGNLFNLTFCIFFYLKVLVKKNAAIVPLRL